MITNSVGEARAIACETASKAAPGRPLSQESGSLGESQQVPRRRLTPALNHAIDVDASGLLRICSWCVSRERRLELRMLGFTIREGCCEACRSKREAAA